METGLETLETALLKRKQTFSLSLASSSPNSSSAFLMSFCSSRRDFLSYTVHGESSGQLGGNLHAATNQGLPKHMLEGLVKVGAVAKFADHGNGILQGQREAGPLVWLPGPAALRSPHATGELAATALLGIQFLPVGRPVIQSYDRRYAPLPKPKQGSLIRDDKLQRHRSSSRPPDHHRVEIDIDRACDIRVRE
ncbi:hypothetical protein INR49_015379 [Caranx melampygus]|nr:hypothetical protein INR49_015379 [Caranx melampygus]